MFRSLVLALALLIGAPAQAQESVHQAFDAQILQAPVIVPGADTPHLVYELHLTNFSSATLTLTRVDVVSRQALVATLEGDALDGAIGAVAPFPEGAARGAIAPGGRVILYMRIAVDEAPRAIAHRLHYQRTRDGVMHDIVVNARETSVSAHPLPELGPPLRGGPWVAVYHPDWERGHRRVFYAIEGRARLPGRFAIDWMAARGGDGRGAEVLAVANGVVVAMRSDFPDAGSTLPATLANATGNYVAIDIGGGRYAFYEHLAQDVRVTVGQRVRRGQVIGTLGASGQVTRPHLHFHLADANAPLEAEGLPYRLRHRALGSYETIEAFNAGGAWREGDAAATPSFPAPMMVVEFPD